MLVDCTARPDDETDNPRPLDTTTRSSDIAARCFPAGPLGASVTSAAHDVEKPCLPSAKGLRRVVLRRREHYLSLDVVGTHTRADRAVRRAVTPTESFAWREVAALPSRPARRIAGSGAARWLFAVALAAFGPVTRSMWMEADGANVSLVAAAIVVASLLTGVAGERRWAVRIALSVVAGAALIGSQGEEIAIWAVAGIGLGDWAIRGWSPAPRIPGAARGGMVPATALLALAAWNSWNDQPGRAPLIFVTLAVATTAIGVFVTGFHSWIERFAAGVGAGITKILFTLMAIPVVVVPWLAHRVTRVDSLRLAARAEPGWAPRSRARVQPARLWAGETVREPPTFTARWRRLRSGVVMSALSVGLVVAGVKLAPQATETALEVIPAPALPSHDFVNPAAYEGIDWYEDYVNDASYIVNNKVGWYPLRPIRMSDVSSGTINIHDGVRDSWTPPECECRRVVVWMYGGSTAFGVGQRDEFTIASHLARLAWEEGYAVDIKNKGNMGDLHYEEANRFAWDLTVEEEPDLVFFYDGVNELWSVVGLQRENVGDIAGPYEPNLEELWREIRDRDTSEVPPKPRDLTIIERGPEIDGRSLTPEDLGQLAATRYERSRAMSISTASHYDIPVEWFWQPSRLSRPPVDGEPPYWENTVDYTEAEEQYNRDSHLAAEAAVPDGVRDVTGALEGTEEPMFVDDVHHNEEAARLIAAAIYPSIRDEIAAAAAKGR